VRLETATNAANAANRPSENDLRATVEYIETYLTTMKPGDLIRAVENGNVSMVRLMLQDPRVNLPVVDTGLNPYGRFNAIYLALRSASTLGRLEIVKMLLRDPRVGAAEVDGAFLPACNNGHADVVELLLGDARVDPTLQMTMGPMYRNAPFKAACRHGRTRVVKLLLQDGRVDPTIEDNVGLKEANERGHVGVVQLLLRDPRVLASVDPEVIGRIREGLHGGSRRQTHRRRTHRRRTHRRRTHRRRTQSQKSRR